MGCSSMSLLLPLLLLTFSSIIIDSRVAEARLLPKSVLPLPSKVGLPTLPEPLPNLPLPEVPVPSLPLPTLPLPNVPLPDVPVPTLPLPNVPLPAVPIPSLPIPKLTAEGVKVLP